MGPASCEPQQRDPERRLSPSHRSESGGGAAVDDDDELWEIVDVEIPAVPAQLEVHHQNGCQAIGREDYELIEGQYYVASVIAPEKRPTQAAIRMQSSHQSLKRVMRLQ